ncbi:MAG TPA: DUF427 domain-containing protein [Mycobacterium sp.]|nr:DUF427 domain-containing protein [Mycobacterium sp.]
MSERPVLTPTAEYPITVAPTGHHVTVRVAGEVVAETDRALTLQESRHAAVQYIPMPDVRQDMLTRTDTASYCPFKGDASYYSVTTAAGTTVTDAIWSYEQPFPAVAAIVGHVAFYPDKADISIAAG